MNKNRKRHIAIVGAGFSGATVARLLAESGDFRISIFEQRGHIAGNCHTQRDESTGVLVHQFGPHIFHTSDESVWNFVRQFAEFVPFVNRVKAVTDRGVFSLPVNLLTLNQFFGKRFTPQEAKVFLASLADPSIQDPKNFEEQALKMVGRELYENFLRGYTKKQWGVDPKELPADILKRLPVRVTYEDNYFESRFQGMPKDGYTALIAKMLEHDAISVYLNQPFEAASCKEFDQVFYSGALDHFYGRKLGALSYRTLNFERIETTGIFQGNPVLNYCSESVPYTRIAEHNLFSPWENHEKSVAFAEYAAEAKVGDILYYPKRLAADKIVLGNYAQLAHQESNVTFIGRLGTYRYLDMHVCIAEAAHVSREFLAWVRSGAKTKFPAFVGPAAPVTPVTATPNAA